MVRASQVPFIRAVARAALEQKMLSPGGYDGVVRWIDRVGVLNEPHAEDHVIRQASAMLIRRVNRSASVL